MVKKSKAPKPIDPHLQQQLASLSVPVHLEALLLQITNPNTQQIAAAEVIVKAYLKMPECCVGFVQQLQGSQHAQVRSLAAVLMRKRVGHFWGKLDNNTKTGMKEAVLRCLVQEPERSVRKNISGIIAQIARKALAKQGWNELHMFIYEFTQSQNEDQRELAFIILTELAETMGMKFSNYFIQLKPVYVGSLGDPSKKVKVQALKACAAVMSNVSSDDQALIFQDILPGMLTVARICIQDDETTVCKVLEVFCDMVHMSSSFINPCVSDICLFCIEVLGNGNLENSTRDSAGMLIGELAEGKPTLMSKRGHIPEIVRCLLHIMAVCTDNAAGALLQDWEAEMRTGTEEDEEDDDEDFDGPSPQNIAQQLLDTLAMNIPPKAMYEPTMSLINEALSNPDPNIRKAGAAGLGVVVEGFQQSIRKQLPAIMPYVFQVLQDQAVPVRECACFLVGQLSEHCQPEILEYHSQVLPIMFYLLEDATMTVQLTSCHVLETFCENIEPDTLAPYLPHLMQKLMQLIHSPKIHVQSMAIGAIMAIATGAQGNFQPYLNMVAPYMMQLLTMTDKKYFNIRGRALDCMARMGLAVGEAHFQPYINPCFQAAEESIRLDDLSLKEDVYIFFANVAKLLEANVSPYLPSLVPHLLEVVKEQEGELLFLEDEEDEHGAGKLVEGLDEETDGEEEDIALPRADEDDDEDEDPNNVVYDVHTAMMDVKKAAIFALGELAEYTGANFVPYLEQLLDALQKSCDSFNMSIRQEISGIMPAIVKGLGQAYPQPWVQGEVRDMEPHHLHVCKIILPILLDHMEHDEEEVVSAVACESLAKVLEAVGPALLKDDMNRLNLILLQLWQEKLGCQVKVGDEEDEEEEDEDNTHDLMQAGGDLCGACAKTLGPLFIPYFDQMVPFIVALTVGSRPETQRELALGTFAEVCQHLGADGRRYFEALLPVVKRGMADSSRGVRNNAAFCAGLLFQNQGADAAPFVMEMLQALRPLFEPNEGEEAGSLIDNAAAAVARIIMAVPHVVPVQHVMPVFLSALPLKSDMNENEAVYKCLHQLIVGVTHPDAVAHVNAIMAIYGKALENTEVQDEVKSHFILPSIQVLLRERREETIGALHHYKPEIQAFIQQSIPLQ